MTDRELLELAAKAGGMPYHDWDEERGCIYYRPRSELTECHHWNALADDGDALRLAVEVRLTVKIADHEIEVFDQFGDCLISIAMFKDGDYKAATRRAIVRAAAEIGKGLA